MKSRETKHTSKGNVDTVKGSKGKITFVLGSPDLVLVLGVHIFAALHSQIPLLHQLALNFFLRIQQALQIGSMSSFDGSEVAGQFLHLGLELNFNLGKPDILSLGTI